MKIKCNFIEISVALVMSCLKILKHGTMVKKGNSLCERVKGCFLLLANIVLNYC